LKHDYEKGLIMIEEARFTRIRKEKRRIEEGLRGAWSN